MERLYPKTKFAAEDNLTKQFEHICSELLEALLAKTIEERDIELGDLEHSIQTYFDIRARQGLNVDALRREVVKKNALRGYYNTGGTPCGKKEFKKV